MCVSVCTYVYILIHSVYRYVYIYIHKESACQAGDPGLGRSPGEGNDNPLHYSCLGNPMDRGAWQATVHVITKESDMARTTTHEIHI